MGVLIPMCLAPKDPNNPPQTAMSNSTIPSSKAAFLSIESLSNCERGLTETVSMSAKFIDMSSL